MSGSVNMVVLVGRLGQDPEIRVTQDQSRIANLSVATSESWRDRNSGERRERTTWNRVVIFDEKLVEVAEKYLRKGSQIFLRGSLQNRSWEDQQGNKRYAIEVVLQRYRGELTMLDGRSEGQQSGQGGGFTSQQYANKGMGQDPQAPLPDAQSGGFDPQDCIPF